MPGFVAYYRVSTARQGRSGLGLAAQRETVAGFLNGQKPIASFTEVESGTHSARPELRKALALAKVHKAVLVVAKLDRLSRNVAFLSTLLESGVEVTACDMPGTDRSWMQMAAVWAEREAKLISERTRQALARSTKRLGGYRGIPITTSNAALGRHAQKESAGEYARAFAPLLDEMRAAGIESTPAIAAELNQRGVPTRRQGQWHAASVARLLARINA